MFRCWIILLGASLVCLASSTCNRTHGRAALEYDYDIYDYIWDEEYMELELCCNETTLKASWEADDVYKVRKLEYWCSNNKSGQLIGKNNWSSYVDYTEIKDADMCSATLSYLDEYENQHHISTSCTVVKDLCLSNPCRTHESCSSSDRTFKCTCRENFDSNCTLCENGYQFSDDESECICQDGDLRLVNGASTTEGQVEICMHNKFGAICDNSWSKAEAHVVCRLLGFDNESLLLDIEATPSLAHVNGIQCNGNETSLLNCSYNMSKTCSESGVVGVRCEVLSAVVNLTPTIDVSTQSAIGTAKKIGSQYIAVSIVFFIGLVGVTIIFILLIIIKRNHRHENHKVQIDKYFSEALDVNFEPIDIVYSVPVSISLQSVATNICTMEKENFTSTEFAADEKLEDSPFHSVLRISDLSGCGSRL